MRRLRPCQFGVSLATAVLLLISSHSAAAQRSALTATRNVAELTHQAATIVRGHVVGVRVEPHPELTNLTTVVVTLRVDATLKGKAGTLLTFRQFVWEQRDKYEAAGYSKGQELLLLLNPVSTYGLTSPAGMEQGKFLITRDAKGNALALNGHGNVGLFHDVEAQARQRKVRLSVSAATLVQQHQRGAVPLMDLEAVIRQFAGTAK